MALPSGATGNAKGRAVVVRDLASKSQRHNRGQVTEFPVAQLISHVHRRGEVSMLPLNSKTALKVNAIPGKERRSVPSRNRKTAHSQLSPLRNPLQLWSMASEAAPLLPEFLSPVCVQLYVMHLCLGSNWYRG